MERHGREETMLATEGKETIGGKFRLFKGNGLQATAHMNIVHSFIILNYLHFSEAKAIGSVTWEAGRM